MSDALLSLPVAGVFWGVSAVSIRLSARHLKKNPDSARAPRMGVLAAFVFAAQMINFAIPGTGSSGHFAGGVLLALLLGPAAGFMALASVLTVQALFFGDGGLLALGANIFNMAFLPCFVAVPLIARPFAIRRTAVFAAAISACALGAFAVALESTASGVTRLPFRQFAMLMVPLHVVIGAMEGLLSVLVLEQMEFFKEDKIAGTAWGLKKYATLALAALLMALVLRNYASTLPDGLEYSVNALKNFRP